MNSAVFVAIHKLRKDINFTPTRHYDPGYSEASPMPVLGNAEREMIEKSGLKDGDRIVWLSDNGPEFGVVKWIGTLPDTSRRDVTVGVEFVSLVVSLQHALNFL